MGRPAGSSNMNKRGLAARLKEQYGAEFDVIMMMAKNCQTLHELAMSDKEVLKRIDGVENETRATNSATLAINALDKLAQYVEPKLKAIEVTGENGGPILTESLSDADLQAIVSDGK